METPRTYAEANKIAEDVTDEEIARLIAEDDNPYVFPAARKTRRIAMWAKLHFPGQRIAAVGFEYCNRNGYTEDGFVYPSVLEDHCPIFHFENHDRIVRWVRS